MKVTLTLALASCCLVNNLMAQDQRCFSETFSGATAGWTYSQRASVQSYSNPLNGCTANMGIVTPGVGGNNPCNLKTPVLTSGGGNKVKMTFDMFVMAANLKCDMWKNFACETSMDVVYYVGNTAYQGAVDYTLPPNGPENSPNVVVNFYVGSNLPAGTQYQVELFFKFKSGVGNCVQQNTKYIFDNFVVCEIPEVAERSATVAARPTVLNPGGDLLLYPNPTMGATKLSLANQSYLRQSVITDITGRVVRRQGSGSTIDINGLGKGSYFIQVLNLNGEMKSSKLIIN